MRILYGVQGTGHGHISRAKALVPKLREYADVDVLMSGYNFNMAVDGPVIYQKRGLSLAYDNAGGIDFYKTFRQLKPGTFLRDVQQLPVDDYDFVVNDYEPVSAWAARRAGVPCVGVSHQVCFLSDKVPRPEKFSWPAEWLLQYFAPGTAAVGSHYRRYADFIEPPVIREPVKKLCPVDGEHITVYLPAYHHRELIKLFRQIDSAEWQVFSPACEEAYRENNVQVFPVSGEAFLESIECCKGVVTAAGFETTSEAMYLGKKLMVVPIKNQYEQLCNAAALRQIGGGVMENLTAASLPYLRQWLTEGKKLHLPEVSDEHQLVQKILEAGTPKKKRPKTLLANLAAVPRK